MNTIPTLYYECHITIEPVFDERLQILSNIVSKYGFRVADLLMLKRPSDTPQRSKYDTFCTARNINYDIIKNNMLKCTDELINNGFEVWRYKIEDTILDVHFKKTGLKD